MIQRSKTPPGLSFYFAFSLIALVSALACRSDRTAIEQPKPSGPAAAVQTTTYHAVGVVKSMKADAKQPSIEIDHEDIPDLMPAMTMEFYVKDKSLLGAINPGDRIEFTMENGVGGLKITEIRKL